MSDPDFDRIVSKLEKILVVVSVIGMLVIVHGLYYGWLE